MAFVAVNKDGSELIFDMPPEREANFYEFWQKQEPVDMVGYNILPQGIEVPKGAIEKLIGKKLTDKRIAKRIEEGKTANRTGIIIEIDEVYVEIIKNRIK